MTRSPQDVAQAHLRAVESGDVVAMAQDYAHDAVLVRGDETHTGRSEIYAYFATVPARLGDARVIFESLTVTGNEATFAWHLDGAASPISGTDVCEITDGFITRQVVHLNATDF